MDREPEELQFLGFFGIYKESYKIIVTWRKIFAQITLSLILPLAAILLAHIEITDLLLSKINGNEEALERTQVGSSSEGRIMDRLSSEWTAFFLFKALYLLLVLVLSLLLTSAVVYSIAAIYTAKNHLSFRKVLSVVPKVWKRLMVTFLWNFIIMLAYNTLSFLVVVFILVLIGSGPVGLSLLIVVGLVYLFGLVYISVIWHLASVVSVLEDSYGIQAMQKSKALIRGKAWIAGIIFLKLNLLLMAINFLFSDSVVHHGSIGARIGIGVLLVLALSMLILFGLVIQTIIYFVCKSYHHENVDKSCLADHLEEYLGEYEPLKDRSVQLEQIHV